MKEYKNGDRCPCCGKKIEGRSDEWLELFSSTMYFLGLSEYDGPKEDRPLVSGGGTDHA